LLAKKSETRTKQFDAASHSSGETLLDDPRIEVLMAVAIAFHDVAEGKRWLKMPSDSLGKKSPLSVIGSKDGRQKILNELALIEHGMF